ncbi:NADH-ubiquinone oxidoreductase 64 kDa subunit [Pseudohyphozyma bogoriensis]|nr:NADH-ubiquinone oxidoreductase 64 kDa subunit [Pseudohyphozyma bogoriensis]
MLTRPLVRSTRTPLQQQLHHQRPFASSSLPRSVVKPNNIPRYPQPGTPLPFWRRRPVVTGCIALPFVLTGSVAFLTGALLLYDASTYADRHTERVPVNPMLLHPERGGKKNLKVAKYLVGDNDPTHEEGKQRMVIVGGGWGSVGLLKNLDPDQWHVTVVAPENYFLFHPLLPSATVGTVEVRSLVEPLRKIIARVSGHFLQAKAVDIDFSERLLEVQDVSGEENFYLPYDKLVIACGSVNSTHGVPGLENCHQLKTVGDAQAIRRKVMDNLEKAALPSTEEEERQRLLSFVVCGGGPTGVEFASELFDMVNEDVLQYMPKLLRDEIKVSIIQSRDHILNTYSEKISEYAEKKFARNEIDMILNARVKSVSPTEVAYTQKDADGKTITKTVNSGFTLWSTGIAMNPFTERVASLLPNQYHKHALEVDSHLRVIGAPLGTVYALGDCATVETRLVDHLLEMVDRCDVNHDGVIDEKEFDIMMKIVDRKFPTAQIHVDKIRDIFDKYADPNSHVIGLNELAELFLHVSKKMTALPATAQVANQQGVYLGKKFSKIAKTGHDAAVENQVYDDPDDMLFTPFKYKHLGSLAYIGNSAVLDFGKFSWAGGLWAMYAWRGVYFSEQVSFRSRMLLMVDWVKRGIWGRDLSRF